MVALQDQVPLEHVLDPLFLVEVHRLVRLPSEAAGHAALGVHRHVGVDEPHPVPKHLVSNVLVEVDVDLLDGPRQAPYVEHVVVLAEVVAVLECLLILEVLIDDAATLSLVIPEGLGHLVRDVGVHDPYLVRVGSVVVACRRCIVDALV